MPRVALKRLTCVSVLCVVTAWMLAACSKSERDGEASSQIVARVNDGEISIHQVQTMMQLQPAAVAQWGDKAPERVLDSLIEQELAAQGARQAGLDKSPRVLQAMELAKREVLARAYQDHLTTKAAMPDDAAIDQYYDAHPELFAQRRQYMLQETVIKAPASQTQALQAQVPALGSVDAVNQAVAASKLAHSQRHSAQWAEALPMDVLTKLAGLKPGQSMAVSRPESLVILTVLGFETVPMPKAQASGAIREALWTLRRKEVIQEGMTRLKEQAKVSRQAVAAAGSSAEAVGAVGGQASAAVGP